MSVVKQIQEHIEKLEAEANQLREERDAYKKHAEDFETLYLQEHRAKNASIRENAKLVKALEWYGDSNNYDDAGELARTTLSELRGGSQ